jgi:pimeloyl-ACP methyl ester carboxylesterase
MNILIDGYNICYKVTGTGEDVVVMLQGWGTDLGVYDIVANTINEKYRFVQFDFPGFGGSDEPREAWNVDAYADFFCKFMEALKIKKVTLVGHSYGGRVIIKLATRDSLPFEIERIVLVDSAGILPKKSTLQKIKVKRYKILKKIFNIRLVYNLCPELVDDWKSRQGSVDYRNATPIMRQCLVMAVNEDLTDILSRIKQETLLIWGDKDTATPIEDAKLMEEKIPNAGLAVIKGTGHFPFIENPVVFGNIMKSYFGVGL